jgi:hypothetical protein
MNVVANAVADTRSTHVLVITPIDLAPLTGGVISMVSWVYVPSSSLVNGQTGPEFGVQRHFVNVASGILTEEAAVSTSSAPTHRRSAGRSSPRSAPRWDGCR